MNKRRILIILTWCSLLLAGGLAAATSAADSRITIKLDKQAYVAGEPFTGTVAVFSPVSVVVPKTFLISLYRGEALIDNRMTSVPEVFFGDNEYSLQTFGIPPVTKLGDAVGHWKLVVQEAVGTGEGPRATAEFDVVREEAGTGSESPGPDAKDAK